MRLKIGLRHRKSSDIDGKSPGGKTKRHVTFNKVEVQEFFFDKEDFPNLFYTRTELQVFNQSRFADVSYLRQKMEIGETRPRGGSCDMETLKTESGDTLDCVLIKAYGYPDTDAAVTIRGIEHFVYSLLQKEMIARKKRVQKEVLDFANGKYKDATGSKIADLAMLHSLWARDVATERGTKYAEQQLKLGQVQKEEQSDEIGDTGTRSRLRRSRRRDSKFRASFH